MNDQGLYSLLIESLELVASYLFSQSVELDAVGTRHHRYGDGEQIAQFLHEIETRHAIACGLRLKDVLIPIEQCVSNVSLLVHEESKGSIQGRLDIPRYVIRRMNKTSRVRSYPIVRNRVSPQTPENALVVQALRRLGHQLARSAFPRSGSAGLLSVALHDWVRARVRRWPWNSVARQAPPELLRRETIQRIRRRQTGNELGYSLFLQWFDEWQADISKHSPESTARLVEGLLAFPTSDFFWERVLEIWCLYAVGNALLRLNCKMVRDPLPLHRRSAGPIYTFDLNGELLEVWFQRQAPLGPPSWHYVSSQQSLRGIPDIVISSSSRAPLILDAKYRRMMSATKPEETYKMLGYAYNFRQTFESDGSFKGVLVFIGDSVSQTELSGPNGSWLTLMSVRNERDSLHDLAFERVLSRWICDT